MRWAAARVKTSLGSVHHEDTNFDVVALSLNDQWGDKLAHRRRV